MGRSLRASKAGLAKVKKAFNLKGWTQEYLAGRSGCSRGAVINLFAQRPVSRRLFRTFCAELGLEWGEIAEVDENEELERSLSFDTNELIVSVRQNIYNSIIEKCGFMRVLDMSQPIGLDDIYTDVNILEKITGRRRLGISELLDQAGVENFERFSLSGIHEERVPGLQAVEQHSKLMILGKPGAGKTTFLKHLAIQCAGGKFKPKLIPLFITLKDFAEASGQPSLLNYIAQLLVSYGMEADAYSETRLQTNPHSVYPIAVKLFLRQGRVLVLLGGLDEVRESDDNRVLQQIQNFTDQFYRNSFIVTCRIAAKGYTFERFTEVEVADFDNRQIETFVSKWFQVKQDLVKAETFIDRLKQNRGIRELATSPILLTLLCLVFEESGTFPINRSELYKEGLDVLLKKWDAKRNIERDQAYKKLSLRRKEDLLSQIALNTFELGNYFFKQKEAEQKINEYIQNLSDANVEKEALQLDSEAVLKAIEAQHGLLIERARGIYSFSHLTFHEYFAAHKLVASSKADIFAARLLPHLCKKRWREVFLLVVGMIESADKLLLTMNQQISNLVAGDDEIQEFLIWVENKCYLSHAPYKPAAVRAFYLAITLTSDLAPNLKLAQSLDFSLLSALSYGYIESLDPDLDLDLAFSIYLNFYRNYRFGNDHTRVLSHDLYRDRDRDLDLDRNLDPAFYQSLQALKDELLLASSSTEESFSQWWAESRLVWVEQLRSVMVQYRNIGQDWQFSIEQKILLKQYCYANQLLVDCLNSDCYVSREVRQEIETGLLLPTREVD